MHIGKEIKKIQGDFGDGVFVLGISVYSTCSSVIFKSSLGLFMGSCTWGYASLQGKKWDNENFKTHITGPRYYDTVKLPKRPRVDKSIELGRRSFLFQQLHGTSLLSLHGTFLLSPHTNGSQWHTVKITVTHTRVTPTRGLRPPLAPQMSQQQQWDTASSDTHFGPAEGCPFGGALERGLPGWFGSPGCLAGCSSCHQQSLQPARSPTLNSFPILYSLPADNRLSIRSPAEHLQLSSLSCTSAWPLVNSSIPNSSHTSHFQLFCPQNCPDSRGGLGN